VRFEGCNLDCSYCDTENEIGKHEFCVVEDKPGTKDFQKIPNPLSVDDCAEIINDFLKKLRIIPSALPVVSHYYTGSL